MHLKPHEETDEKLLELELWSDMQAETALKWIKYHRHMLAELEAGMSKRHIKYADRFERACTRVMITIKRLAEEESDRGWIRSGRIHAEVHSWEGFSVAKVLEELVAAGQLFKHVVKNNKRGRSAVLYRVVTKEDVQLLDSGVLLEFVAGYEVKVLA